MGNWLKFSIFITAFLLVAVSIGSAHDAGYGEVCETGTPEHGGCNANENMECVKKEDGTQICACKSGFEYVEKENTCSISSIVTCNVVLIIFVQCLRSLY